MAEFRQSVEQGNAGAVLAELEAFAAAHPGNAHARFVLANAYAALGREDQAVTAYRQITEDHPYLPEPYNNLAMIYARRGDLKEARDLLLTAMNTHPSYATAYNNLTNIYARQASIAYQKALERPLEEHDEDDGLSLVADLHSLPAGASTAPAGAIAGSQPPPHLARQEVVAMLKAWAQAWSSQDVDAYLDYYAAGFIPPDGAARQEWERERRYRLKRPDFIKVEVGEPKVTVLDSPLLARVSFRQAYLSDSYRDEVAKVFLVQKSDQGWQILQEEVKE